MPITIASWNCCLGLQNKIDVIKSILQDYEIDVLFLQETEIKPCTPINNILIPGYNLELSSTYGQSNSRTCCYVRSKVKYKIILHPGNINVEAITLELFNTQVTGVYKPFLLPNHTSDIEYVTELSNIIKSLNASNLIILGDFNIDFLKINTQNYNRTNTFNILEEVLIEKTLVQLIKKPTWERVYNNSLKQSLLDHIYCNNIQIVETITNDKQVCGDHNLVAIKTNISHQEYPEINKQTITEI